jgi:hypothetical protein
VYIVKIFFTKAPAPVTGILLPWVIWHEMDGLYLCLVAKYNQGITAASVAVVDIYAETYAVGNLLITI